MVWRRRLGWRIPGIDLDERATAERVAMIRRRRPCDHTASDGKCWRVIGFDLRAGVAGGGELDSSLFGRRRAVAADCCWRNARPRVRAGDWRKRSIFGA